MVPAQAEVQRLLALAFHLHSQVTCHTLLSSIVNSDAYKSSCIGSVVEAYGTVDKSGTYISWSVDGGNISSLDTPGMSPAFIGFPFFSISLQDGGHTLIMTSERSGSTFSLDHITVWGSQSHTGSTSSSNEKSLSPGAIVAIVISTVVLIGIVTVAVFLFQLKRRKRISAAEKEAKFELIPNGASGFSCTWTEEMTKIYTQESETHHTIDAIHFKHTTVGYAAQAPQSSTLFTSVIIAPTTVVTSYASSSV